MSLAVLFPSPSIFNTMRSVSLTPASQCKPNIQYTVSNDTRAITGVAVRADGDACGMPVPVTLPGAASASAGGVVVDQVGSEPIVAWTPLGGTAVEFTLNEPVTL